MIYIDIIKAPRGYRWFFFDRGLIIVTSFRHYTSRSSAKRAYRRFEARFQSPDDYVTFPFRDELPAEQQNRR